MAEESRSSERTFAESPPLQDLIASDGTTWTAFRSSLRPRYGEVWKDLALIFCCWLGGFSVHVGLTASLGNSVGLALLPVVASWLGFWMAAIGCFTHEAAHFCIHPDRRWNDRLANVVLCPLTLNEIERYRARHWQHHLHLGNSEDTEISYRNIPGTRFVLESLFGIQLLGALHRWNGEIAQQSVTIRGQRWPVLLASGFTWRSC